MFLYFLSRPTGTPIWKVLTGSCETPRPPKSLGRAHHQTLKHLHIFYKKTNWKKNPQPATSKRKYNYFPGFFCKGCFLQHLDEEQKRVLTCINGMNMFHIKLSNHHSESHSFTCGFSSSGVKVTSNGDTLENSGSHHCYVIALCWELTLSFYK